MSTTSGSEAQRLERSLADRGWGLPARARHGSSSSVSTLYHSDIGSTSLEQLTRRSRAFRLPGQSSAFKHSLSALPPERPSQPLTKRTSVTRTSAFFGSALPSQAQLSMSLATSSASVGDFFSPTHDRRRYSRLAETHNLPKREDLGWQGSIRLLDTSSLPQQPTATLGSLDDIDGGLESTLQNKESFFEAEWRKKPQRAEVRTSRRSFGMASSSMEALKSLYSVVDVGASVGAVPATEEDELSLQGDPPTAMENVSRTPSVTDSGWSERRLTLGGEGRSHEEVLRSMVLRGDRDQQHGSGKAGILSGAMLKKMCGFVHDYTVERVSKPLRDMVLSSQSTSAAIGTKREANSPGSESSRTSGSSSAFATGQRLCRTCRQNICLPLSGRDDVVVCGVFRLTGSLHDKDRCDCQDEVCAKGNGACHPIGAESTRHHASQACATLRMGYVDSSCWVFDTHPSRSYIETLDLSHLGIVGCRARCFDAFSSLRILDLSHNSLTSCTGVASLKQLWHLNLAHNNLSSVSDLMAFSALGLLDVSYNNIMPESLLDIMPLRIIRFISVGNPFSEDEVACTWCE